MSIFANILGVMGDFIVDGVNGVRMKVVSNVMQFRSQGDVSHRGIQVRDIKIMNDNASNGITLTAPASQGSNITHTLPGTAGNTGDVWTKKADGTVGYESPGTSGGISQWYAGDLKHSLQLADHGKWLLCNGAAVSRSTYAALFAVIGTFYGAGNGSTTFNLPNFENKFLRGSNDHTTNMYLTSGGSDSTTLSVANLPAHNHALEASSGVDLNRATGGATSSATGLNVGGIFASAPFTPLTTLDRGDGSAFSTVPAYRPTSIFIFTG